MNKLIQIQFNKFQNHIDKIEIKDTCFVFFLRGSKNYFEDYSFVKQFQNRYNVYVNVIDLNKIIDSIETFNSHHLKLNISIESEIKKQILDQLSSELF